jgi:hypothetical protein
VPTELRRNVRMVAGVLVLGWQDGSLGAERIRGERDTVVAVSVSAL